MEEEKAKHIGFAQEETSRSETVKKKVVGDMEENIKARMKETEGDKGANLRQGAEGG